MKVSSPAQEPLMPRNFFPQRILKPGVRKSGFIPSCWSQAMRPRSAFILLLFLAQACSYAASDIKSVPENPTYEKDVRPLLADHCFVCHGSKANRNAPAYLRLDVYDDQNKVLGANTLGERILARVADNTMPPAARDGDGVGPNGKKMLELWVANGKPR
jgi:hypothetical protein